MEENNKILQRLEQICQKQHEELEQKRVQVWDLEEENEVLKRRFETQQNEIAMRDKRIDEYENWCAHLQKQIDQLEEWRQSQPKLVRLYYKIKRILR